MSSDHDQVEREALSDAQTAQARPLPFINPAFASAPVAPAYPPMVEPPSRERAAIDDIHYLEDLYTRFAVGNGEYVLRVERRAPKNYAGVRCDGLLADLDRQISISEFADMFGGGDYVVCVRSLKDGRSRTVKELRFAIPGHPKTQPVVVSQDLPMSQHNVGMAQSGIGIAEAVLRHTSDAENRAQAASSSVVRSINEAAEQRAAVVAESLREQIRSQQAETARARDEADRYKSEAEKLRRELVDQERKFNTELNQAESRRERDLRATHEAEMGRLRDANASSLETLRRDSEQKLEAQRQRFDEELRRREERDRDERTRLSENHTRDIAQMKSSYDQQIATLLRDLDRERSDRRTELDRELRSRNETHAAVSAAAQQSYTLQIESMRTELTRSTNELASVRAELERLRREAFKPPLKAIEEAKSLVAATQSDDGEREEGPTNWMGVVAEVGKATVPALASMLTGGVRPPGPVPMPMPHTPPGAHALPAHHQQQQMRPQVAPVPMQHQRPKPRWMVDGPRGPGDTTLPPGADAPVAPARPRARVPIVGGAVPQQRAAVPFVGEPMPAPPPSPLVSQQVASQVQPEAQPQPQLVTEAPEAGATAGLADVVNAVFDRASAVIETDEKPPAEFAHEFIQMLGPQTAYTVVTGVSVDDVIARIEQQPGGSASPIVSVRGRRYVRELWAEVAKLLSSGR